QDAFSRLLRTDLDPIEDARAWLVVVVSRLCLDQLRSARVKRETYIGPWFPEPLLFSDDATTDPADIVTMDESVRFALLVVLERMSPAERVVFVLHDVFDFPFEKVAPMVGRTVAACRQLASRARKRVEEEAGSARFAIDPAEQRRVVDAFIAACAGGDIKDLLPLLDPSVMGWADMGGRLPAVSQPNVGHEAVGSRIMRFFGAGSGLQLVAKVINGEASVVAFLDDQVVSVLALSVTDHLISRVYVVSDARKLAHVKRVLEQQ
ncbi:MAG TPA: sigma factor-like helix-turn-helix DNA-binding protein, partial [Candidatus Dormibacteraeota bacterium]|nr:sigma factor-like helix-turn-helix DNA-binding protein [Candidatus Dormibacteraeota bacterium]